MNALLAMLARALVRRPGLVLLCAILPSLGLSAVGAVVHTDLSFMGVLDQSDPEVARFTRLTEELGLGGSMFVLIEGPEARLDDALSALAPALLARSSVRSVVTAPPAEWLAERAPWMVPRAAFDEWVRLAIGDQIGAVGNGGAASAQRLVAALEGGGQHSKKHAGVRLAQVNLRDSPLRVELGSLEFFAIDELTQRTLAPFGATGSYAGLPASSAQDQAQTLGVVQRLTPISLVLVLLLVRLLERRLSRVALVGVPLVLAGGATLGIVGLVTGQLTVMESFFGIMIFGLGVDFAILMIVRMREEQAAGHAFDQALSRTLLGVGPSIIAGALTTAGAFLIVAAAPDPTALHLGLSGGIGVALCLVLMLTVLPASWSLLERRASRRGTSVERLSPARPMPLLGSLARHGAAHPKLHVAAAVVVTVAAGAGASRYHFETDLEKVFNRNVPAARTVQRVQEIFGVNAAPWLVVVDDLATARRVTDAFAASPVFASAESVADLIPADLDERRVILERIAGAASAQAALYEGLAPLASKSEAADALAAATLIRALPRALAAGPPTIDTLPTVLRERYLTDRGRFIVAAYSARPNMDGHKQRIERLAAQAIHPEATGMGAVLESIMAADRPWAWPVVLGILAWVVAVLFVDFRRLRLIAIALAPVVISIIVTFGGLCWAGVSFNLLTTLVVPLIIGLGVDSGIHVVHRIQEFPDTPIEMSAAAVGRALVLNTATTSVGFAALMFTDHAGMESMGLVMLIGLPLCLFASMTTVPALAVLFNVTRATSART